MWPRKQLDIGSADLSFGLFQVRRCPCTTIRRKPWLATGGYQLTRPSFRSPVHPAGTCCSPRWSCRVGDTGVPRMRRKPLRPAPERGPPRRQRNRLPGRDRLPGRRQVRHQDTPRHPVDHKVMDSQPADVPERTAPHRATPPAPYRRPTSSRPAAAAASTAISACKHIVEPRTSIRRKQAPAATAPARRNLKAPFRVRAARIEPQPQRIMMIEQRLPPPLSDAPSAAPPAPAAASPG